MALIELNEKLNSLGLPNFPSDEIKKYSELILNSFKIFKNFGEILKIPQETHLREINEIIEKIEMNKEEATIKMFLNFLKNEKNAKLIKIFYSINDYFAVESE